MRFGQIIFSLTLLAAIAGCTTFKNFSETDAISTSETRDAGFTGKLGNEYRVFSNHELIEEIDYSDSLHFAKKGLANIDGSLTMSEPVGDWNLSQNQYIELLDARNRLTKMINLGAIKQLPEVTAIAQSRFDCWIETEEEINVTGENIDVPCKKQFFDALAQLESRIRDVTPPPAPRVAEPAPKLDFPEPAQPLEGYYEEPVPLTDAVYLVFFDFDSSRVSNGAQNVLDAVATEINNRQLNGIVITGHADTSGSKAYNQRLGQRRANSVKSKLQQMGISNIAIETLSSGENELLVQTSDGTKEPANRRATITFR